MSDNLKVPNFSGRRTFDYIFEQLEFCIKDIAPLFLYLTDENIYKKEFYNKALALLETRPKLDLKQLALCDIAYNIVFFGVSSGSINILSRLFEKYYNSLFIQGVLFVITKKPHIDSGRFESWIAFRKTFLNNITEQLHEAILNNKTNFSFDPNQGLTNVLNSLSGNNFHKYYGGFQFELGHYYRHLFQTVKYINEQNILKYKEKYEYIKTLRAQLSTPEQYLLFFNSISVIGRDWEFNNITTKNTFKTVNRLLITKYNLIKNIPDWFVFDKIDIKNYYPDIDFEFADKSKNRLEIETYFK
ncbi:hypothetical protein EON73_01995 [bacterium]|nr:MAG: hypothetical protein EON73_01995 [bacterium]